MVSEFKPGDILRNGYAGEKNPCRDFLFLKKGICRQGRYTHKTYDGIDYKGREIQIFRDTPVEKIGHMPEYDAFMSALSRLADSSEIGLKPCPFCGSTDVHITDEWPHYVHCLGCGAIAKKLPYESYETGDEGIKQAAERWNRRAGGE